MNIKDYLHLYLPVQVELDNGRSKVYNRLAVAVGNTDDEYRYVTLRMGQGAKAFTHSVLLSENRVRPILRPLSDMTEEEAKHFFGLSDNAEVYCKVNHGNHTEFMYKWEDGEAIYDTKDGKSYSSVALTHNRHLLETYSDGFLFLLSKHFDLFGLIEAGLAIDATQMLNSDSEVQVSDTTEGASSIHQPTNKNSFSS
jgi:hypothetical protein